MKLAERIYPWGQCFNSLISNLKSQIDGLYKILLFFALTYLMTND